MPSGYFNYDFLPTPGRMLKNIKNAEEMEEHLESLPPPLSSNASSSQSLTNYRPGDLYDVGVPEATLNTTFLPRTRPAVLPSDHNSTSTPRPPSNQQPTNTDAPQSTLDSPLTSTPATVHLNQRSSHSNLPKKPLATLSPNVSHIPQNQHARQCVDGIILVSSGTENENPQPNILEEDSPNSSDSEGADRDLSRKSLGELDLGALDDYMGGFESDVSSSNKTHSTRHHQIRPQKSSTQLSSSPSSSQSTLIAHSHDKDAQHNHLVNNNHALDSSEGKIPSPGVARRDSFRADHSASMDDIHRNFSQDVDHESHHSKRSSPQRSQSFHPEPISIRNITNQNKDQPDISNPSSTFRVKSNRQTKIKSLQSEIPQWSAKRTFVAKHLKDVTEDSTDLSRLPPNQFPPVNISQDETESISHDLTTYPVNHHPRENSSFSSPDRSQRFDGNKLNSFLHTLNGHLSEENQRILNLLSETKAKLQHLTLENQTLRDQTSNHNPAHDLNESDFTEQSVAIFGHIQGIIDHSISQLDDRITTVQGDMKDVPLLQSSSQNVLLERQNRRLQDQVEQRDDEIKALRDQLMNNFPATKALVHKDNMELKDHLSDLQKELGTKDDEVVKLRLQLIETSGQHASVVSELNAKYEQTKESLFETQEALTSSKLEVEKAKIELETRMSALKSEFAILLEEQGKVHASINSRFKEARRLNDTLAQELKELKANQSKVQPDSDAFARIQSELQQVLEGNGDHSIGRSARRRVEMLVSWIGSLISNSDKTNQDVPLAATRDVEKSNQETQQLRRKIEEFRVKIEELIQESSDKHNQVETLEKLLEESESTRISREHEFADLKAQTDILEAKVVTQQAAIQGLEVKLSHVLNSTFSDVSFTPRRLSPNRQSVHYHVELSKAQHEINRLKDLLDKSGDPAACEIQNMKIKALEAHRNELEERVGSLRRQASALMSTPSRSSIHFQSVISMRTPKTPGQFLGNATSTFGGNSGDDSVIPMLNQINELHQLVEQLRHQLDLANKEIDQKLEKLQEANSNTVQASVNVVNAQKIAEEYERKSHVLEQRLDKLIEENGMIAQLKRRLSNIGCPECGEKFDANEVVRFRVVPEAQELEFMDQPADIDTEDHSPTLKAKFQELEEKHKSSQAEIIKQKRELGLKSDQLEQLELEKVNNEKEIEELHDQLSSAQHNIEELEFQLKEQQVFLREISTKQEAVKTEKDDLADRLESVNLELRRTQDKLSEITQSHNSADAEIRAIQQSKKEISQTSSTQINQLQKIISKFEAEKAELTEQRASLVEELSMRRRELESQAQLVTIHEKSYHRVQALLEKHSNEAAKLRTELEAKSNEAMQLKDHKDSLVKDTKGLRKELVAVKSEAQNLAHDLQRIEEQVNRQSSSTNADEITKLRNELTLCKKELKNYATVKPSKRDSRLMPESTRMELERKHNSESKGLLLRIRFLKLMITRESLFRADLAFQKKLIMVKLHRTETTNRAIHLALADFGLPYSLPPSCNKDGKQYCGNFTIHSTDRSFKSIAIAVRAICKLRILSRNWSKEVLVKEKLKVAYKDVRGKEFIAD